MEYEDIINDQHKKLGWYSWLQRDLSALVASNNCSAGVLLQVIIRGITNWAYAKYGREKAPKERFMAICMAELQLPAPFAAVLYSCKRGYGEMGIWPQDLTLSISAEPEVFLVMKQEESVGSDLAINVVALTNLLMETMARKFPHRQNGHFRHLVAYTDGIVILEAIEYLRNQEKEGG